MRPSTTPAGTTTADPTATTTSKSSTSTPTTADHINVRSAQFTSHTDAELWLIAHLTTTRPFGQGRTYRIHEVDDVELDNGLRGADILVDEPDGWCYLDNAASEFDREGDWLPRQQRLDIDS